MSAIRIDLRTRRCAMAAAWGLVAAIGAAVAAPPPGPASERPQYTARELGTLGGAQSAALAMNDRGIIVGWSEVAPKQRGTGIAPPGLRIHAVAWIDGAIRDLGTLGGDWAEARGVNDRGEIVGVSTTATGERRAFRAFRFMEDLNDLAPIVTKTDYVRGVLGSSPPIRVLTEVNGIDDLGRMVACGTLWGSDDVHGFLLVPVPGHAPGVSPAAPRYDAIDLGTLPQAAHCRPLDLNRRGLIVGASGHEAFVWGGTMKPLEEARESSCAVALNGRGAIVGWACNSGLPRPILWARHPRDAGTPFASAYTDRVVLDTRPGWMGEALDLNDAELVVGWAAPRASARKVATLWQDGAMPMDLNQLLVHPYDTPPADFRLTEAVAIDAADCIAATGLVNGHARAFLLLPADLRIPTAFAPCPCDLDGDGQVVLTDLVVLLSQWGPCAGCAADVNGDGAVAFDDLTRMLADWGPCP